MPATVIAERIGWTRGITVLKQRVAELRPAYLPPDPASRTSYEAGEIAQCDLWFPPIQLPVGFGQPRRPTQLPVLTMVTGYSRWLSGQLIPTRAAPDLFAGWWQVISRLGAVPRTLVWDGEGAIGRWRHGKTELTGECQAFRGTLGTKVVVLQARASRSTRASSSGPTTTWRRSFLPGRRFTGPADFNTQLQQWFVAGQRPPSPGARLRPDGADRRGQGGDAGVAAGRAGDRMAGQHPAGTRSLRAHRLQRLLRSIRP